MSHFKCLSISKAVTQESWSSGLCTYNLISILSCPRSSLLSSTPDGHRLSLPCPRAPPACWGVAGGRRSWELGTPNQTPQPLCTGEEPRVQKGKVSPEDRMSAIQHATGGLGFLGRHSLSDLMQGTPEFMEFSQRTITERILILYSSFLSRKTLWAWRHI